MGLKVAITHPTCWPHVRRGSERLLHDLSHCLARMGHDVTVLSSSPDGPVQEMDGQVRRVLFAQQNPFPFAGRWFGPFHAFAWQLKKQLKTASYDVVFCLNYHDAAAAIAAKPAENSYRVIFQCTGIPIRRYFRRIPFDGFLFEYVTRRADTLVALSRFAADALRQEYGRTGILLPSLVDIKPFEAVAREAPAAPRILFVGDADEPRKGALLLAKAFRHIHERTPQARLIYSGNASETTRGSIMAALPPELHSKVEFLGLGRVEDLPRIYSSSTVCINPAAWEALGNVLIEALAAGVPVVGCRHGGTPDIINDPRIGVMFEPGPIGIASANVQGLADAILSGIRLATEPDSAALCRGRARCFSWEALGPKYDALMRSFPRDTGAGHLSSAEAT